MKKLFSVTGRLFTTHLSAILISLIVNISLTVLVKKNIVCTAVTLIIYISMIYSSGWTEGFRDSRRAGECFPSFKRAFTACTALASVAVLLYAVRVLVYHINPTVWTPYGNGYELIQVKSVPLTVADALCRLWSFYFTLFIDEEAYITYIIPAAFPIITYPLGYAVGLKRFSFIGKYLPQLVYKPKKKR